MLLKSRRSAGRKKGAVKYVVLVFEVAMPLKNRGSARGARLKDKEKNTVVGRNALKKSGECEFRRSEEMKIELITSQCPEKIGGVREPLSSSHFKPYSKCQVPKFSTNYTSIFSNAQQISLRVS